MDNYSLAVNIINETLGLDIDPYEDPSLIWEVEKVLDENDALRADAISKAVKDAMTS